MLYEQNQVRSRAFINYWRTIKPVVTSVGLWAAETEELERSISFLNTLTKSTQVWRWKVTAVNSKQYAINQYTHDHEKTYVRVFFDSFFAVHLLAKRYMLQQ